MTSSKDEHVIERATQEDIPSIQAIVNAAYTKYIERIGKPPTPMTANYAELLQTDEIYVLRRQRDSTASVVGGLVASTDTTELKINNLVVDPAAQGRGYGRMLMEFAERLASERGLRAMTLYTNVKMFENVAMYPKLGFVETERRSEDGYDRVFFRKDLK